MPWTVLVSALKVRLPGAPSVPGKSGWLVTPDAASVNQRRKVRRPRPSFTSVSLLQARPRGLSTSIGTLKIVVTVVGNRQGFRDCALPQASSRKRPEHSHRFLHLSFRIASRQRLLQLHALLARGQRSEVRGLLSFIPRAERTHRLFAQAVCTGPPVRSRPSGMWNIVHVSVCPTCIPSSPGHSTPVFLWGTSPPLISDHMFWVVLMSLPRLQGGPATQAWPTRTSHSLGQCDGLRCRGPSG